MTDGYITSGYITYLKGRVSQVFDAPNHKRPRWTVQDAHAVRETLRRLETSEAAIIQAKQIKKRRQAG